MENKRKRPYHERTCKKLGSEVTEKTQVSKGTDPLYLVPKLWRKLPSEVAYMVLSFLPVNKLIDTLRRVNRRWEKLMRCHAFAQIFGHGHNLNSSYGIAMLENRKVPRLTAFEHESQEWRKFPKSLCFEMKQARLICGSRDGLMLCENKKCKYTGLRYKRGYCRCPMYRVHYPEIGIWNPILRSLKWLPENPNLMSICTTLTPYSCSVFYAVMVDEPSRTYQVFNMFSKAVYSKYFYSVYSSTTGSWSSSKSVPDFVPSPPGNRVPKPSFVVP